MEVRDGTVWDGGTAFAVLEPAGTGDAMWLRTLVPAVMDRDLARRLVRALVSVEAPVAWADELTRYEARRSGWTGPLRAPLRPPARPAPAGTDVVAIADSLLDGLVLTRRVSARRTLALRVGDSTGRRRLRVRLPDRGDLMPEVIAAAVDTALAIHRRFGRMASFVQTVAVDDGAGGFDNHTRAGSTQGGSGTIYLETSLVAADAMSEQRVRMGGRAGVSARVPPPWSQMDGVVAHEIWHNMDSTLSARPAVYVELNRALGAELGVDTYEHALQGGKDGAPPAWRSAWRRIVTEVSPYATTNWRESSAELFKVWWCRPPDGSVPPLVACFGEQLDRHFPPPG